jgi:hypothetical protein
MTSRRSKQPPDPARLGELRAEMERKKAMLDSIKIAYFHRAPFGDGVPNEQAVRDAAESFIQANYDYQKALYGRVRVKLSASNLLR